MMRGRCPARLILTTSRGKYTICGASEAGKGQNRHSDTLTGKRRGAASVYPNLKNFHSKRRFFRRSAGFCPQDDKICCKIYNITIHLFFTNIKILNPFFVHKPVIFINNIPKKTLFCLKELCSRLEQLFTTPEKCHCK